MTKTIKWVKIILVLIALSVLINVLTIKYYTPIQYKTITDSITYIDTIKHEEIVPVDSVVISYIEVPIPVARHPTTGTVGIELVKNDSLNIQDSVHVRLPLVQKEYKTPDYHLWVSGYVDANLDSIITYKPTTYVNITPKYKPKRWGLGIQLGVTLTENKAFSSLPRFQTAYYIGIGVSYNLFVW